VGALGKADAMKRRGMNRRLRDPVPMYTLLKGAGSRQFVNQGEAPHTFHSYSRSPLLRDGRVHQEATGCRIVSRALESSYTTSHIALLGRWRLSTRKGDNLE
jgi:hypothetical protein